MSSTDYTPTDEEAPKTPDRRGVGGATRLMMTGILLSRLLGLVRERVIAHQFGQSFWSDVYRGAFTIPDLLFFLIAGGALSAAFIPVFTEHIATGRRKDAWRIFSVVSAVMMVVVTGFIILGEVFAVQLVRYTNPGYAGVMLGNVDKLAETVRLTRILLPAQICFFLGGLMMGSLNSQGLFAGQAFGPVIYNLGIIFGGVVLAPRMGVMGLCWGAVGGAVIGNLGLQWFLVRRSGGYFVTKNLRRHLRHPGVIQVWKLMLPVILGLALPQVSTIIGKVFASTLGNGKQSAFVNANQLMQVPLGVFAQAAAIAIFPTLAAQAARKEIPQLRSSINYGIRSILFLTIPASVLMFVLATPMVQLIFQTGKFTGLDTPLTANILRYFSVGIFAWSAHAIITRGFYALQDSITPIVVGTVVTLIYIPMNFPLRALFGVSGLALATSIAATIHMASMLFLLRRRLHGIEGGRLLTSTAKMLLASGVAAAVCIAARKVVEHLFLRHHITVFKQAAIVLTICLTISSVLYIGLALVMRMDEADIARRLLRRLGVRAWA